MARLLSSLSVPHFYPSLFVHVTDTLDIFGELVYQRLLSKAKEERAGSALPPLTTHFNTSDVLELTRITARNWFGKIAAIKELIPRLYGKESVSAWLLQKPKVNIMPKPEVVRVRISDADATA